jgi:nucleotide-binding universal stress UspA family protein
MPKAFIATQANAEAHGPRCRVIIGHAIVSAPAPCDATHQIRRHMVSINRILCAVDFSDFSLDALRHGLVLAQWYSAQLTLFHVYQASRPLAVEGMPGAVPVFLDVDPNHVADEVRRFCAPLLAASEQHVEVVVTPGDAAKEIMREAERLPADMLIVGTHGRSGFERLFLGSVTEKVLRSTRVPVLTSPPPVREPGSPVYKTILCPLEFSDASLRALEYALSLAREANARLIVLHVIEEVFGHGEAETLAHLPVSEYYRHLEQEAITRLKKVIPDEARVWSRPDERVVNGRAYQEILKTVADERVDLVVMGVQGKSALSRFVFGSTTHRVIREADCPVLTLHSGSAGT